MMEKSFSVPPERLKQLEYNYSIINERIAEAAQRSGRAPEDIQLVCVTKTVPVELVNYAISLGARHIGENKVQELASKYDFLEKRDEVKISVIGHLQTNKAKKAVAMAQMIQSVDSEHLSLEIAKRSQEAGRVTECMVEVNIGGEENKTGISAERAEELVLKMEEMTGIKVVGLMTIPPFDDDISKTRRYFEKIHKLFIDIGDKKHDNSNVKMKYLSMGMSSDYYEAIVDGSNMVRIGSALFGARKY